MNRWRSGETVGVEVAVTVDGAEMIWASVIRPEGGLKSTPGVDPGEAPRAAASFNHQLDVHAEAD